MNIPLTMKLKDKFLKFIDIFFILYQYLFCKPLITNSDIGTYLIITYKWKSNSAYINKLRCKIMGVSLYDKFTYKLTYDFIYDGASFPANIDIDRNGNIFKQFSYTRILSNIVESRTYSVRKANLRDRIELYLQ